MMRLRGLRSTLTWCMMAMIVVVTCPMTVVASSAVAAVSLVEADEAVTRSSYIGGHGDKTKDRDKHVTHHPTPAPSRAYKATDKPTKAPEHTAPPKNKSVVSNSSLYVHNPAVHVQHSTEYVGGVVEVQNGIEYTPMPTLLPTPAPTQWHQQWHQKGNKTIPPPPKQLNRSSLHEMKHESGWGGTYVHNDSVNVEPPQFDQHDWPIKNATGSKNHTIKSVVTTPINNASLANNTKAVQSPHNMHVAGVGTYTDTTTSVPVQPTNNKLESTSVQFGGTIVSSSTTTATNTTNTTSESDAITSTLHTTYNNVEYGHKSLSPRVDIPGHCVMFGFPSFLHTFDGETVLSGGLGEFILYANSDSSEQVNVVQHRVSVTSWVKGLAFRTHENVLTVSLEEVQPSSSGMTNVAVRMNGKPISLSAKPQEIGGYSILQEGKLDGFPRLSLTLKNANGTKVATTFYKRQNNYHMDVFVQVNGDHFGMTKGLCGVYNFIKHDDRTTPDTQIVESDEQFVASWGVHHPQSPFQHFLPHMDPIVVNGNITRFHLERDTVAVGRAKFQCNRIAMTMPNMKEACVMNALMGHKTGIEEIRDIVDIVSEGVISVDKRGVTCADHKFELGHWRQWGNCSSLCGKGVRSRKREMVFEQKVCGELTQSIHCQNHCERPELWSKCALWGGGHVATFDQVLYDFQAPGEYTAYYDPTSKEEISILRYRPRNTSSVVVNNGLAFRLGADLFTIQQVIRSHHTATHFTFNNRAVDIGNVPSHLGFFTVKLTMRSNRERVLEVKTLENTIVTITFGTIGNVPSMNAFIEIHGTKLGKTSGMCGVWNLDPMDDLRNANGNIETSGTVMAMSYRRHVRDSVFFFPVPVGESPPPVNPTYADLHPSPLVVATAKKACNGTSRRYRQQCLLDVAYLHTIAGAQSTLDVQTVMLDHRITADRVTAKCLEQPGTKLGNKSAWSQQCSKPCGSGKLTQTQPVINAIGRQCGVIHISKPCNTQPCPHDCQVSEWSAWSECSSSCGKGTMSRHREVLKKAKHQGKACPPLEETVKCTNTTGCCKVSKWKEWGPCQNGKQIQWRDVNYRHCGWNNRTRPCCEISHWSEYSPCQNGISHRTRLTQGDEHLCSLVNKTESQPCCNIGQYGDWSKCTSEGYQFRQRILVGNPSICAHYPRIENRTCCSPGPWSDWSQCTSEGVKVKRRTLKGFCEHDAANQTKPCCTVGDWQPHTKCHHGYQTTRRTVVGDKEACSGYERVRRQKCCVVHDWSKWTPCSRGVRSRTRRVIGHPEVCQAHPSVDTARCCKVEQWSVWGPCMPGPTLASPATQTRRRILRGDPLICGQSPSVQNRSCCAALTPWSEWSACKNGYKYKLRQVAGVPSQCATNYPSKVNKTCCDIGDWSKWSTCRNGRVKRTRKLVGEQCHLFNKTEEKPCCHVHDWSDWSGCVNGWLTRTRKLEGDAKFCKKWHAYENKPCCEVGAWGDFSECKGGVQSRVRNVTNNPQYCGGIQRKETRKCCETSVWSGWTPCMNGMQHRTRTTTGDTQACLNVAPIQIQKCCKIMPWSRWSKCKNFTQHRTRKVLGHEGCDQDIPTSQFRTCGELACKPGNWSTWSTCENGRQTRYRTVYGADICTDKYPANQTRNCTVKVQPCSVGEWSPWTRCKDGQVRRWRTLSGNCSIDHSKIEHKPCRCIIGAWSEWSPCEHGHQHHTRVNHGTCAASVATNETRKCVECTVGAWSAWSKCLKNHTRTRHRKVHGLCMLPHSRVEVQNCTNIPKPTKAPKPTPTKTPKPMPTPKPQKPPHMANNHTKPHTNHTTNHTNSNHTNGGTTQPPIDQPSPKGPPPEGAVPLSTCHLGEWSSWSDCDPSTHQKHRVRSVSGVCRYEWPIIQYKGCHCFATHWSEWTDCQADGYEHRYRNLTQRSLQRGCTSDNVVLVDNRTCCEAMTWSKWSNCSVDGVQTRNRTIKGAEHCLLRYPPGQSRNCCYIGPWSAQVQREGYLVRSRLVTDSPYCRKHYNNETRVEHCLVGEFNSTWSTCSVNGTRVRRRYVDPYPHCLAKHKAEEEQPCCELGVWSRWSECIADGTPHGSTLRNRTVVGHALCHEHHPTHENKSCASCELGPWSAWSECTKFGYYYRNRTVEGGPWCERHHSKDDKRDCCHVGKWNYVNGLKNCDDMGYHRHTRNVTNSTYCLALYPNFKRTPCCYGSAWTPWSQCNVTSGYKFRTREVGPAAVCINLMPVKENKTCCVLGPWTKWNSTCVNGTTTRTRTVEGHSSCLVKHRNSQTTKCCNVGAWGPWSRCELGKQSRTRRVPPLSHCIRKYKNKQERPCCSASKWSTWSKCEKGVSMRSRHVFGGTACEHKLPLHQTKKCCSVGEWGEWSACDNGVRRRVRIIEGGDAKVCPTLPKAETKACDCACQSQGPTCPCYVMPTATMPPVSTVTTTTQTTCHCLSQPATCPCAPSAKVTIQQHSTHRVQPVVDRRARVVAKPRFAERHTSSASDMFMVPRDLAKDLGDDGMAENFDMENRDDSTNDYDEQGVDDDDVFASMPNYQEHIEQDDY